jgi:phosphoglycolate phosphatase
VIWDFNGTLIDDIDPVVASVNSQLEKRGLPRVTTARYREVFGFPVEDYYRRLGLDFENETIAELAAGFFAEYTPKLQGCSLHEGIAEALDRLASLGVRQFVLLVMEQGMLQEMIGHSGIDRFFEGVYGLANQEGASKVARGEELLRDFRIDPASALLIGDTDHDAEVGAALGVSTILVSWGHQSEARLRGSDIPVVRDASELLSFVLP